MFLDTFTALRVLIVVGLGFLGWLENTVFKMSLLATVTWFWALAALTAWIVYPLTIARIGLGATVFVAGVVALVAHYRRTKRMREIMR